MRLIVPICLMLIISACSSTPKTTEYAADRVIARIDGLEKRHDWVTESQNVKTKNGKTLFIGTSEVPGDSRVQAAFKLSDSATRGAIANKIETNVLKIVENSETGLSMEDQQLRSLIREVSQINLRNVDIKERYWEKVVRTQSDGEEILIMKVFSLIEIPNKDLKKLMIANLKKNKQNHRKDLRNKVENLIRNQWDNESF